MRTLSAGSITAKDARQFTVDWLVESAPLGLALSYAYEGASGGPATWEHRILQLSEVEHSIPPGGGVGAVSSFQLESAGDRTGMSLLNIWNQLGMIEGQQISLSMLFAGEAYADKIPIFTGEIDKASWSNGVDTLQATDTSLPSDVQLPQELVTRENYPSAPDQSMNQPLPLVYGNGGAGRLALAPLLLVDGASLLLYRVAGHAVARLGRQFGVWPQGARRLRTALAAATTPGDGLLQLASSIVGTVFTEVGQTLALSRYSGAIINPINLTDGDPDTLTQMHTHLLTNPTDNDGQAYFGAVLLPMAEPESANIAVIDLRNHRRGVNSAATVSAILSLRLVDIAQNVVLDNLWQSPQFRHISTPKSDRFTHKGFSLDANHNIEAYLDVQNEGGLGTEDDYYELGEITLSVGYQPNSALEPLFADSTVNANSVGLGGRLDADGTITGTANTPIENPADVIRSILVQELARPVNSSGFTAARAAFPSQYFDGGIGAGWSRDRVDARGVLNDMALQAHSYLVPQGDGSFSLHPYDAESPSRFDFTSTHILLRGERDSSFNLDMSDMDLIANSFRVRYAWHPGLRQFAEVVYATPGGSNHPTLGNTLTARCVDSQARYGDRRALEVDAYWITHEATAAALLAHLVNYFWTQQMFASFDTTLAACHLEPGDFVTLTHPDLPTLDNGGLWEVLRTRFAPSEGTIFLILLHAQRLSFTYFAIKSQDGQVWWWWVSHDQTLSFSTTAPTSSHRIGIDLDLDPIPYWIEVEDSASTTWYLYPRNSGEPTGETSAPPVGTGLEGSPVLTGQAPGQWVITATTLGEVDVAPAS